MNETNYQYNSSSISFFSLLHSLPAFTFWSNLHHGTMSFHSRSPVVPHVKHSLTNSVTCGGGARFNDRFTACSGVGQLPVIHTPWVAISVVSSVPPLSSTAQQNNVASLEHVNAGFASGPFFDGKQVVELLGTSSWLPMPWCGVAKDVEARPVDDESPARFAGLRSV